MTERRSPGLDFGPMSDGPATNLLYYGDNLDVLRLHVKDECVDLVYFDPPLSRTGTYAARERPRPPRRSVGRFTPATSPTSPL